jgi:hypothetical protein
MNKLLRNLTNKRRAKVEKSAERRLITFRPTGKAAALLAQAALDHSNLSEIVNECIEITLTASGYKAPPEPKHQEREESKVAA